MWWTGGANRSSLQHKLIRAHLSSCCDSWVKVISFSLSVHISSNAPMLDARLEHSSSNRSRSPAPASPPPSTPWLPEGGPPPTPPTPDSARAWVVSRCNGPLVNKYTLISFFKHTLEKMCSKFFTLTIFLFNKMVSEMHKLTHSIHY